MDREDKIIHLHHEASKFGEIKIYQSGICYYLVLEPNDSNLIVTAMSPRIIEAYELIISKISDRITKNKQVVA